MGPEAHTARDGSQRVEADRPIDSDRPHADTDPMTIRPTCNLCGALDATVRAGRLGRYSCTCDRCETRRGSHLVGTERGYASRAQLTTV